MLSRRVLLAAGLSPAPALLSRPSDATAQSPDSTIAFAANKMQLASSRPPAAVIWIELAGYETPGDGGGGGYRRVFSEPVHPGKAQAADGSWWELCEHNPTPEMFGADGTYDNDTKGLQSCCDYVRVNYIYTHMGNNQHPSINQNSTAAVYLNSRTYYINKSIDLTDNGRLAGLSIVGKGSFGSIISAKLDEAFPVLDMAGVAYARVSKIQIRSEPGDLSSCCLLIAQVAECVQHNNSPIIEESEFVSTHSPNSAAALVVQAGDLLKVRESAFVSTVSPACSVGSGLPSLYHGNAIAAGSDRSRIQLNVSGNYNNDPANLGGAIVGKNVSIWPIRQWNSTNIRKILSFDKVSNTISLDNEIPFMPTESTQIAILSLSSKYKNLSNVPDNTFSVFESSSFAGTTSVVLRSQGSFFASDCYFANISPGSNAIIRMDDYLFASYEHVARFTGGCRWENQAVNNNCNTIEIYNQVILLHLEGELANGSKNGAHIVSKGGGSVENICFYGADSASIPLLNILDRNGQPGFIKSISGIGKWQSLGVVGQIGHWSLQPISSVGGMLDAVGAVAKSGNYQVTPLLHGPSVIAGVKGIVTQVVELQPFDPVRIRTNGGSSQRCMRWTLPAGALTASGNLKSRFHGEFVGGSSAPVSGFGVQLNCIRPGRAGTSETCSLSAGVTWRVELDIMRLGTGWAWSGSLWNGSSLANAFHGALPDFDEASDIYIDLFENASIGNATDVTTYFGQLS